MGLFGLNRLSATDFIQTAIENEIIEEIVDTAAESAYDKAANEGQISLLDECLDGWREYAALMLQLKRNIDRATILGMTDHPQAIIIIANEFVDECEDAVEAVGL